MGSDSEGRVGEKPAHRVTLTKGFYLGKTEVTQAQWRSVMGYNPSLFEGPDLPVVNVSWDRVQVFLRTLNQVQRQFTYRLPTEAEWEFACRAGSEGDFAGATDALTWHAQNVATERPQPVGQKQPNAWGLHDMHGNVWEWCQDWLDWNYYATFSTSAAIDPTGPASGSLKVYRGGAWNQYLRTCTASHRYGDRNDHHDEALGFRVAADKR